MRHFVAYHNTERMGRSLRDSDPLRLLTNKPVERLMGDAVWFVVGDGASPKRYTLGSVFVVEAVGEAREQGFERFATGPGHVFQPAPSLNDLEWFAALFQSAARFSLGVLEITDPHVVEALASLAAEAGYKPLDHQKASAD